MTDSRQVDRGTNRLECLIHQVLSHAVRAVGNPGNDRGVMDHPAATGTWRDAQGAAPRVRRSSTRGVASSRSGAKVVRCAVDGQAPFTRACRARPSGDRDEHGQVGGGPEGGTIAARGGRLVKWVGLHRAQRQSYVPCHQRRCPVRSGVWLTRAQRRRAGDSAEHPAAPASTGTRNHSSKGWGNGTWIKK